MRLEITDGFAFVLNDERPLFCWFKQDGARYWQVEIAEAIEVDVGEVLDLVHAHRAELDEAGLDPRGWWVFWPCPSCGAGSLTPCRSLRGRRLSLRWCHRGRRPGGRSLPEKGRPVPGLAMGTR